MNLNFTGQISQLGYGLVTLNILKAAERLGHKVAYWPIHQASIEAHPSDHELIRRCLTNAQYYDCQAPSIRIWHQFDLAQHVGVGPRCGFPIFELNKFNDLELHHLRSQDILFVASEWAKEVLTKDDMFDAEVHVAPLGVDSTVFRPTPSTQKETVFLNCGKFEVRKGHDMLYKAFDAAFQATDDVRLVMNCHNPFYSEKENGEWRDLYLNSKMGRAGKVYIVEQRLPWQQDVAALMADADCGVFPSRAEGWNLEAGEMLAMGKHLIITDYSAHTEFCDTFNAQLITVEGTEPAFDGKWFLGQGDWAKFDDDAFHQLVVFLRDVHKRKQEGSLGMNLAGIETMNRFTWEHCVESITEAF